MKKNLLLFILVIATIMVSFSACVVERGGGPHGYHGHHNGHYNRY
ncbi:hypothetical protein [Rhizosphaericola mali]|nr:hypothetical protein [Rhizosphaericola mali]